MKRIFELKSCESKSCESKPYVSKPYVSKPYVSKPYVMKQYLLALARALPVVLIITIGMLLSGCDGWLGIFLEDACAVVPDSSHCYQQSAVQNSDAAQCAKIKPPKDYEKVGSNPPKDKCYLMIAQNTGDTKYCRLMQGGVGSYEKEECFTGIAVEHVDPQACRLMSGAAFEDCREKVSGLITMDSLSSIDGKINDLKEQLRDDPKDPELKAELEKLEKEKEDIYDFAKDSLKSQYFKEKREDIMSDVDDSDVSSEIAAEFRDFRKANPDADVDELVDKLKTIKEEKEFAKRADEIANEMVDALKSKAGDYADEKKQELIDAAGEEGWKWMKENSGDRLKYYLGKMEDMKDKYDKASDAYQKLNDRIEKIKKVYDEVAGVYKKMDEYNQMLAEGKIQEGHAKVLKGAVLLGKGLEYATSYVPVFGSTVSTVTKETFETTMKLAKERAKRSTAMEKCFDDPANCDPDKISAY